MMDNFPLTDEGFRTRLTDLFPSVSFEVIDRYMETFAENAGAKYNGREEIDEEALILELLRLSTADLITFYQLARWDRRKRIETCEWRPHEYWSDHRKRALEGSGASGHLIWLASEVIKRYPANTPDLLVLRFLVLADHLGETLQEDTAPADDLPSFGLLNALVDHIDDCEIDQRLVEPRRVAGLVWDKCDRYHILQETIDTSLLRGFVPLRQLERFQVAAE